MRDFLRFLGMAGLVLVSVPAYAAAQPDVLHVPSPPARVNPAPDTVGAGRLVETADDAPPIRPGAPPLPGSPATSYAAPPPETTAPPPAPSAAPAPQLDQVTRAYVAGLQRALPAHGYHPGPETGRLDPATEAAILAYQRDAGMAPDARSAMALKATIDNVYFARPPIMAQGARPVGAGFANPRGSIAGVQARLADKGFPSGPPDNRLGRRTVEAIQRFQSMNGMAPTGRIDARLVDLLEH